MANAQTQKEIRRDSRTGFEKFEDYFDSDSDNTTIRSENVTTVEDSKANNGNTIFLYLKTLIILEI